MSVTTAHPRGSTGWAILGGRALGYLALGLPMTMLGWALALFVIIVGALLSLTVIGLTALPPLLLPVRGLARLERRRSRLVLAAPPAEPYAALDGLSGRHRRWARLTDPASWRDLAWLLLAAPVELVCVVVTATLWGAALGLATIPLWYRFLPGGHAKFYESRGVEHGVIASVPQALPWAAMGLILIVVAVALTRILAAGQARLAALLLGPTRNAGLRTRVSTLAATRAAVVEEQNRTLHRLERDLHDGAQARLVALSADLGLAGEAFDRDPELARKLVNDARDGIVLALGELRELVRGIGPPVLTDRGLAAALETVAARSPIPATVTVALPERPPASVETAAYFVVCECLANAAKHSRARRVTVDIRRESPGCVVVVRDNGIGGADASGDGLNGLVDRVAALDGKLAVDSPAGGPTVVRAELPCAW